MRPLPAPYDDIAAGRPAAISLAGPALLGSRLLTKDLAFSEDERDAFRLRGLLPDRVLTIDEQVELELEHLHHKDDALERYIGMAALQDRNATLFYRLLAEHLEEFLPIVYTPTVGRAVQEFSHIIRRTRGVWITPPDRDRIPKLLRQGPYDDVRLIVVTDNERILGLGDQGAGGMAIPIGKLALYTAASGIHPDAHAAGLARRRDRQSGAARRPALPRLPRAAPARTRSTTRWSRPSSRASPRSGRAASSSGRTSSRRTRCASWTDTAIACRRSTTTSRGRRRSSWPGSWRDCAGCGMGLRDTRVVLVGAGAAGIGIARLVRLAMLDDGMDEAAIRRALVLVDSRGQVHDRREDLDATKRELALPAEAYTGYGFSTEFPGLVETIERVRPTVLVGTTGVGGTFDEGVLRALAAGTERPLVMPLSNPTSAAEATPIDILRWTDGRAVVATGSPFEAVDVNGRRREVGQANNVFIFPGLGLGAIAAEASAITDRMFLLAARTLAAAVTGDRLATGALYPPVGDLRAVTRAIALEVAGEAVRSGVAGISPDTDLVATVDGAMWWPEYVPYLPARPTERRRFGET